MDLLEVLNHHTLWFLISSMNNSSSSALKVDKNLYYTSEKLQSTPGCSYTEEQEAYFCVITIVTPQVKLIDILLPSSKTRRMSRAKLGCKLGMLPLSPLATAMSSLAYEIWIACTSEVRFWYQSSSLRHYRRTRLHRQTCLQLCLCHVSHSLLWLTPSISANFYMMALVSDKGVRLVHGAGAQTRHSFTAYFYRAWNWVPPASQSSLLLLLLT